MTFEEHRVVKGSGAVVDDFSSFCEGDIEPTLNKKIHFITDVEVDYIVYVDVDLFVEWSWTKKYGNTPVGFPDIANRLVHLETLSKTSLNESQQELFAGLLAGGMARIVGDKDEVKAHEALEQAKSYLHARSEENARSWYIKGAMLTALITLLIACVVWLLKSFVIISLGSNAFGVILGTLLGGMGALFSVLNRTEKIQVDPTAGPYIHYVESISKVLAGNIGALITALAIRANILFGFAKTTDYSLALLLVVCICAGASERLVPGFIKRVETSAASSTNS